MVVTITSLVGFFGSCASWAVPNSSNLWPSPGRSCENAGSDDPVKGVCASAMWLTQSGAPAMSAAPPQASSVAAMADSEARVLRVS